VRDADLDIVDDAKRVTRRR